MTIIISDLFFLNGDCCFPLWMKTTQNKEWEDLIFLTKKMPQTEILVMDPISPASCQQLMPQERVKAHKGSFPHIQGQRAQVFSK